MDLDIFYIPKNCVGFFLKKFGKFNLTLIENFRLSISFAKQAGTTNKSLEKVVGDTAELEPCVGFGFRCRIKPGFHTLEYLVRLTPSAITI
jgi:hypothetical protein